MCRGAQISLTQIVATFAAAVCRLLPRVVCFGAAIWFAAADAFKFNSQRKRLGKRKKKCASQIGHGAKALARALAHSTQIWPTARFKCAAVDLSYT